MPLKIKEGFHGERSVVVPPYIKAKLESDPFLSTLYITDIGYYPCAEHHYVSRQEAIKQYVLIYCVNGNGFFTIGECSHPIEIHENQYVILPAGIAHSYRSNDNAPWTIYWIHFAGTLASYYAKDAGIPHNVRPNIESRISNRIGLFEEALTVMQADLNDDNLHYASSILHHFLASLRCLHAYRGANQLEDTSDMIAAARHFMKENIERHVTLPQIADFVGLSVSNFSMKFRKAMGCSPIAYINKLKVERACDLLTNTDMHINQVSYKVGINDALYFSRLFSKEMGMAPSEWKARTSKGTNTAKNI